MTERIDSANEAVDNVIEMYKEGTTGCIKKIEQRLNTEHNALSKQWDGDGKRFGQSVDKSKDALRGGATERKKSMSELEQGSEVRQILYDQVSSSLRAFQRKVLSGTKR